MPAPDHKERDWIDTGLKASTPLIVGVVVAVVSIWGDEALNKFSHQQQTARLITQLQIGREQAESALRKDIFTQALNAFLGRDGESAKGEDGEPSFDDMSKQLLRLELLALNFGNTLSLRPLFVEMHKDLSTLRDQALDKIPPADKLTKKDGLENHEHHKIQAEVEKWDLLIKRLTTLAKRVSSSQLSALAMHGEDKRFTVPLSPFSEKIDDISCRNRTTDFSPTLLYSFDERIYSWPHDAAVGETRDAVTGELNRLVREPLELMHRDLKKVGTSFRQNLFLSDRFEIIQTSKEKIEAYMDDGIKQVEQLDRVYEDLKKAIAPVLEFEKSPYDSKEVTEEWNTLKARFAEGGSEDLDRPLWKDIGSYFEVEKNILNLKDEIQNFYDEKYKEEFGGKSRFEFMGVSREIEIQVYDVDHCQQSFRINISVKAKEEQDWVQREFGLDYFNFPIVDNTRLTDNHRLAVVIENFETSTKNFPSIDIALVVFPAEYASLRDRPGINEVRGLLENAMKFEPGDKN